MQRENFSQFYKKHTVMKDDKLHKAINELPVFEAPDVWAEIEKSLSGSSGNKMFWLGFIIVIVCGTLVMLSTNILSENTENIKQTSELKISEEKTVLSDTAISEVLAVTDKDNIESQSQNQVIPDIISEKIADEPDNYQESEYSEPVDEATHEIAKIQTGFFGFKTTVVFSETGENLVNNPSFEDFNICPKGIVGKPEKRLIPYWDVPTKGTPDYFNSCSKLDAGVPRNFAGSIYAHSGHGYCGMILRQNFTSDNKITGEKPVIYREYVQTELKQELVKGKKYMIKFWICNSSKSRFAVDAIGACLTTDKIRNNNKEVLDCVPVVENTSGKYLVNKDYWVEIEGVYEAQGGEKFLTIGNFNNNYATNYIMQNGSSDFNYAYYYLDDVSVFEVAEVTQTVMIGDTVTNSRSSFVAEF